MTRKRLVLQVGACVVAALFAVATHTAVLRTALRGPSKQVVSQLATQRWYRVAQAIAFCLRAHYGLEVFSEQAADTSTDSECARRPSSKDNLANTSCKAGVPEEKPATSSMTWCALLLCCTFGSVSLSKAAHQPRFKCQPFKFTQRCSLMPGVLGSTRKATRKQGGPKMSH